MLFPHTKIRIPMTENQIENGVEKTRQMISCHPQFVLAFSQIRSHALFSCYIQICQPRFQTPLLSIGQLQGKEGTLLHWTNRGGAWEQQHKMIPKLHSCRTLEQCHCHEHQLFCISQPSIILLAMSFCTHSNRKPLMAHKLI